MTTVSTPAFATRRLKGSRATTDASGRPPIRITFLRPPCPRTPAPETNAPKFYFRHTYSPGFRTC